jgi:hypothetical protein
VTRAVCFFGDCDETFDAKHKLCIRNGDVGSAKSGILKKVSKIVRVECPVGIGPCKRPFVHRVPRSHIDDKASARSQHAVGFQNIPAAGIEEIDDVDQQDLVERLVDPRQRAERSLHQHHSTSRYRYLIHTRGLFEHPGRLIHAVQPGTAGARRDCSKGPTRAEAEFKNRFTGPRIQGIDSQPVGLVVDQGHEPSNDRSSGTCRVSQLTTKGVPHPVDHTQARSCISGTRP